MNFWVAKLKRVEMRNASLSQKNCPHFVLINISRRRFDIHAAAPSSAAILPNDVSSPASLTRDRLISGDG